MTKKRLITWLAALYVALLTTLCLVQLSVPSPDVPGIGFDKIVHFCFYAGLNTLLIATIIAHRTKITTTQRVATTLVAIFYGVVIEFIQQHVGRDLDIYDIVANSIGAITAGVLLNMPKLYNLVIKHLR